MLTGDKIFFVGLSNLRGVLNESTSESIISDAIKEKRYLYVYYGGAGIQERGYRIVKPMIMGTRGDGVRVFRGWQIDGNSASEGGENRFDGKPRFGHEYFNDNNLNKTVPGWREFRIDRIISIYPTGNRFINDKLPVPYKGNIDKVITSVDVAIPKTYRPTKEKIPKAVFADRILRRPGIKRDIEGWFNLIKNVKKRSPSKTFLYLDERGKIKITYKTDVIEAIPDERVIGNLRELYDEHILPEKSRKDDFFEKNKRETEKIKK